MEQDMLSALPPELQLLGQKKDMLSQGSWCEVWGSKTPLAPSSCPQECRDSQQRWRVVELCPPTHMPPTSAKCLHTGWHLHFHM